MVEIPVGLGFVALVDDEDAALVAPYKWNLLRFRRNRYAIANSYTPDGRKTTTRMHRLIMPEARVVDHIDGNGLNNQRYNLRAATHQQNLCNTLGRADRRGPYKGVSRSPTNPSWRAKITVMGRYIHLGCYSSAEDAARAYDEAARKHFGEFARTNFPQPIER